MTGIVAYGAYIPRFRIKISAIVDAWKKDHGGGFDIGIEEKSVAGIDEDTITMATEAASEAIRASNVQREKIQAILVGSESHPYAVKPSSTAVGEILGLKGEYFAADLEFACKAGSAGLFLINGLVESGEIPYGIAIGSDVAQSKPGDVLECAAGSGAAAYLLGKEHVIAKLLFSTSYSSDTLDFWRRDGQPYPSHAGRFTGEPAYFAHIFGAAKRLFAKSKLSPSDFDYCVIHMPNGRFPKTAAKKLGFSDKQIAPSFIVKMIGNPYSASSLLGLASVLDIAKPKEKIFVCSYGSGAGSDAFVFEVTEKILRYRKQQKMQLAGQLKNKEYISYTELVRRQLAKK